MRLILIFEEDEEYAFYFTTLLIVVVSAVYMGMEHRWNDTNRGKTKVRRGLPAPGSIHLPQVSYAKTCDRTRTSAVIRHVTDGFRYGWLPYKFEISYLPNILSNVVKRFICSNINSGLVVDRVMNNETRRLGRLRRTYAMP